LSAQLRVEASGPEARAAAEQAGERMEAMGRKPGWSLLLNPTPALLADMGVDPVEYKARIARAAGNDPVRRGERDRSHAARTLMPSQSALRASRNEHTSTVTSARSNDPPPRVAPTSTVTARAADARHGYAAGASAWVAASLTGASGGDVCWRGFGARLRVAVLGMSRLAAANSFAVHPPSRAAR